jgi:acyl carrier protein
LPPVSVSKPPRVDTSLYADNAHSCRDGESLNLGDVVTTETASPYSRQEIVKLIQDRLADILETDPARIAEGASFAEDLDADSLALIELVEALEADLREKSPDFRIEDEDLEDLRTVRDAVDYVYGKLASN